MEWVKGMWLKVNQLNLDGEENPKAQTRSLELSGEVRQTAAKMLVTRSGIRWVKTRVQNGGHETCWAGGCHSVFI